MELMALLQRIWLVMVALAGLAILVEEPLARGQEGGHQGATLAWSMAGPDQEQAYTTLLGAVLAVLAAPASSSSLNTVTNKGPQPSVIIMALALQARQSAVPLQGVALAPQLWPLA